MNYEIRELVPIVARLAEGWSSKQSTSITEEKAQQLMGAVIYCIREGEAAGQLSPARGNGVSAWEMYESGARRVEEKVKEALKLYNELMPDFSSFGNICLHDTVVRGLPEFFRWYDCRFDPQNTMLTLDYPVLLDVPEHTGIDKIYDFILCVRLEQTFLNGFPAEYVIKVLSEYDEQYKWMIDNLCEIVLMNVFCHILAESDPLTPDFDAEECRRLEKIVRETNPEDLRERLKHEVDGMVRNCYDNDRNLLEYLCKAADNLAARILKAQSAEKAEGVMVCE